MGNGILSALSNVAALRVAALGFSLFFISGCERPSENLMSYTANTVEECIQEKSCVWRAFKETVLDSHQINDINKKKKKIAKWRGDINVAMLGEQNDELQQVVRRAQERINPYFPYEIKVSEPSNFLIIALENFEEGTIRAYEDEIRNTAGFTKPQYEYMVDEMSRRNPECTSGQKNSEDGIEAFLVVVNLNTEIWPYCAYNNFYNSLRLRHHSILGLNLLGFDKWPQDSKKITDLHLLIAQIFYDPEFPEIVDYQSAQQAFLKIYPKVLNEYNATRGKE